MQSNIFARILLSFLFFTHASRCLCQQTDSNVPVVALEERVNAGVTQLVGELWLGQVNADDLIKKQFVIENVSNNAVALHTLRPSCVCTEIAIAAGVLGAGEKLQKISTASVRMPRAMGVRTIGEVAIFSASADTVPVAKLLIRAEIFRPYCVPKSRLQCQLGLDENFEFAIPLEVAASTDLSKLKLNASSKELDVRIRNNGQLAAEFIVSGKKDVALSIKEFRFGVSFSGVDVDIHDDVRVEFFDATRLRATFVEVDVEKNSVSFLLSSARAIEAESLQVTTLTGVDLSADAVQLLKGLVKLSVNLDKNGSLGEILVTDKNAGIRTVVQLNRLTEE